LNGSDTNANTQVRNSLEAAKKDTNSYYSHYKPEEGKRSHTANHFVLLMWNNKEREGGKKLINKGTRRRIIAF
jgi:hypothetical protein